jgi:hypothetical protein
VLLKLYGLTLQLYENGHPDLTIATLVPNQTTTVDVFIVFEPTMRLDVRHNGKEIAARTHTFVAGASDAMKLFIGVFNGDVKASFRYTFDDVFFDWK